MIQYIHRVDDDRSNMIKMVKSYLVLKTNYHNNRYNPYDDGVRHREYRHKNTDIKVCLLNITIHHIGLQIKI